MHPLRTSIIVSSGYILICGLYIWLSGLAAAQISKSITGLQSIELYKGLLFILTTGAISFIFVYQLLKKIKVQNSELEIQRKALVDLQARTLAGTIASGIAHDINNVICVVDFDVSELTCVIPESKKNHIERLNKSYDKIREMVTRLQKIGKVRTEISMRKTELSDLIRETISFAVIHKKVKSCDVRFDGEGLYYVNVNPDLIEQMLINLIINAADATESNGIIQIKLTKSAEHVFIEVHDNGPGIKEENMGNIFRPYFTTKPEGTGLGLATVKNCAELHSGSVHVSASILGGALFKITLPVTQS